MWAVVPVIAGRRKNLISEFKRNGATCIENAVTPQEIFDNWQLRGIRALRMQQIMMDTNFLCARGTLTKTLNEKFYLDE